MKGAIRLLSSRDTLAPATHANLTSLRALHPSAPLNRRAAPITSSVPLHVTLQAVLEAITSFPHGSAGGPDGLRPQHLKDLLDGVRGNVGSESVDGGTSGGGPRPIANPLLEAITDLVNLLLSGEVPQFVRASLFGGSITTPRQSHCHVGCLASNTADIIGRLADGRRRHPGAVGLRLGANLCEPHTCTCGVPVDARGTHGLACKRSAGRHPRHGLLNDVVWRAMLCAQVPSCIFDI